MTLILTPDQPNVLVDGSGHARIADFGFATVTQNLDSIPSASGHHCHTPRWTAPEVLKEGTYSKEGDIFSFAMVMIEVRLKLSTVCRSPAYRDCILMQIFTGAIPFRGDSTLKAMLAMTEGKRPSRPTYPTFTDSLWELMQHCWDHDPHSRPEASGVSQVLLALSASRLSQ